MQAGLSIFKGRYLPKISEETSVPISDISFPNMHRGNTEGSGEAATSRFNHNVEMYCLVDKNETTTRSSHYFMLAVMQKCTYFYLPPPSVFSRSKMWAIEQLLLSFSMN